MRVRGTWGLCLWRTAGRLGGDPAARRFVLSAACRNRLFLLTMARIAAAYRTGAMRYLIFRAAKPDVTAVL